MRLYELCPAEVQPNGKRRVDADDHHRGGGNGDGEAEVSCERRRQVAGRRRGRRAASNLIDLSVSQFDRFKKELFHIPTLLMITR